MANGALDSACRGGILLCNRRIENFCDRVYDVGVLDGQEDCGAEILIALDVGRHAYLMDYAGDLCLNVGCVVT